MIKHIFLDMDGTLLNSKGQINAATANYLRQIQIPITLVSARAPMEMQFAIDELNLTGPQMSFNGGMIYKKDGKNNKIIEKEVIKSNAAQEILNFIENNFPDFSVSIYTDKRWMTKKWDAGIQFEEKLTGLKAEIVNQYDFTSEIFKIMIINLDTEKIDHFASVFAEQNFPGVVAKSTGKQYFEITNEYAEKKAGIQYIERIENLTKDEMIAFGDGENDLPMLTEVGHAVAMGNALDNVKQLAEFVTKANDQDGIVYALKEYLR
ncbi:Cof-type HAD-IIB family hydrolase [Lactobacillus crispatus]|jgi:Cof subfamily protein (haloacid dehalogenase superfamily)|uniref:Cof-type HAD-IIB family hydrolase n=1 Tax=Lactobacillus crispatus TaxID=47770 RepID=UPI0018A9B1FE|nr:Cof-type HAD-IIB family hydrolase [Lactobacillus crispatus]MCH4004840.1 Cof-type HAD-IIB family hydrolase [Lactobacillus crispatus]MCI1336562.1 Cof-type HAD-IIB family hydrolase [Lactobacillus crispatus]MCI1366092.1 Cof-type HAD-IIB family hydrolase [Lactobacillus crispatus]MCI1494412.1 Cof-type HAD-IIB family hydrolase [Lactobacillus crispatus]